MKNASVFRRLVRGCVMWECRLFSTCFSPLCRCAPTHTHSCGSNHRFCWVLDAEGCFDVRVIGLVVKFDTVKVCWYNEVIPQAGDPAVALGASLRYGCVMFNRTGGCATKNELQSLTVNRSLWSVGKVFLIITFASQTLFTHDITAKFHTALVML